VTFLLVALGAAVGAPARYLTDRAVQSRHDTVFPWGTLTVNVVGSFVLGLLTSVATRGPVPAGVVAAVGTGFCGALTTYSTFSYETLRLAEEGAGLEAVGNVLASIAAGLGAAALGWAVGAAVAG
jgi:fluoride exporter